MYCHAYMQQFHQKSLAWHQKSLAWHQKSLAWHQKSLAWHQKSLAWHQKTLAWHQKSLAWHQKSLAGHNKFSPQVVVWTKSTASLSCSDCDIIHLNYSQSVIITYHPIFGAAAQVVELVTPDPFLPPPSSEGESLVRLVV